MLIETTVDYFLGKNSLRKFAKIQGEWVDCGNRFQTTREIAERLDKIHNLIQLRKTLEEVIKEASSLTEVTKGG